MAEMPEMAGMGGMGGMGEMGEPTSSGGSNVSRTSAPSQSSSLHSAQPSSHTPDAIPSSVPHTPDTPSPSSPLVMVKDLTIAPDAPAATEATEPTVTPETTDTLETAATARTAAGSPTTIASATTTQRLLVDHLSFSINPGERLGLIGESGSGKSLTALSIMGLLPEDLHVSGQITVGDTSILTASDKQLRPLRGSRMSMVFQEPMTSLNPLMRAGKQVEGALKAHDAASGSISERAHELIASVGLPERAYRAFPHELSGGQRQRILLAMAFANNPQLLICDEPTTALDVTVQKSMLELINKLVEEHNTALLFITHDLSVIAQTCDNVIVLKDGVGVERGPVDEVFAHPQHEYSQRLISASRLSSSLSPAHRRAVSSGTAGANSSAGVASPSGVASSSTGWSVPASHRRAFPSHYGQPGSVGSSLTDATPPTEPLIQVSGVSQEFHVRTSRFARKTTVTALDDVSVELGPGERLGIVGESGSGKSTLLSAMAGLRIPTRGQVRVAGITPRSPKDVSRYLQVVFQDPRGSFDPTMTIGESLAEPMLARGSEYPASTRRARVAEVLQQVGIGADAMQRYPHQFSGGQRQRMSIARALTVKPAILLADEPVSALDVSVRAQVLELLNELIDEYGLAMVFVSHDLDVVRTVCDRVAVLKDGRIVESGPTEQVYTDPQEDYTKELLTAALAYRE